MVVVLLLGTVVLTVSCRPAPLVDKRVKVTPEIVTPILAPAPPGVAAEQVLPRQDESLAKAVLSLSEILATLPRPTYLPAPDAPAPADSSGDADVSVEAQHAYVAGRLAFQQRRYSEALSHLNETLRRAPHAAEALKLAGIIHQDQGNAVRAAIYLEQALVQDSSDLESLLLLARLELRQRRFETAIAILGHGMTLPTTRIDPALRPMIAQFLAGALESEGYDAAAIAAYRENLLEPLPVHRSSRFAGELYLLMRQRDEAWRAVGDAHNRLAQHAEALAAYQNAAAANDGQQPAATKALASRAAYTLLRLGRVEAAASVALAQLPRAEGSTKGSINGSTDDSTSSDSFKIDAQATTEALELIAYVTRHGGASPSITHALRLLNDAGPRTSAQVRAIAQAMPADAAAEILWDRLQTDVTDRDVLVALMRLGLAGDTSQRATSMERLVDLLAAHPQQARDFARALLGIWPPREVVEALRPIEAARPKSPYPHYLLGAALRAQGHGRDGQHWRQALKLDPSFDAARLDLAQMLLQNLDTEAAANLLVPLADRHETEVIELRAQHLLLASGRDAALAMLEEQIAAQPDDADLLVIKARLLWRTQQREEVLAAGRLLEDAIKLHPGHETLYESLFTVYAARLTPDAAEREFQLLTDAQRNIPAARVTRLKQAQRAIALGQLDEAQRRLLELVAEDRRDFMALGVLLYTMHRDNRTDDARTLLGTRLEEYPANVELLEWAAAFYREVGDNDRATELTVQSATLMPDSARRATLLAGIYQQRKQHDKAIDVLTQRLEIEQEHPGALLAMLSQALEAAQRSSEIDAHYQSAVDRFPDKATSLRVAWAGMLDRIGQDERAQSLLKQVLADEPTNGLAANMLGYLWAEAGENLEEAAQLIQIAIDQDSDNAAYLDSLGWVRYKQGRMAEALELLQKARMAPGGGDAVILDHLADTLWRLGRGPEAVAYWGAAREKLDEPALVADGETDSLREQLDAKIHAAGLTPSNPPVAPLAGEAAEAKN